jgi:hypothetical protein
MSHLISSNIREKGRALPWLLGSREKVMRVTVQVAPALARKLRQGRKLGTACSQLRGVLNNLSVQLVPLHPGMEDETLGSYFAVEVPDFRTAETVVRSLRPCPGVRAAYVKPADALP